MNPNQIQSNQTTGPEKTPARGAFIHIPKDGKLGAELVDVTPLELYAALTLIIEKLRKSLDQN